MRDRFAGAASLALGAGMAANAVLGPLVLGVVRIRETPAMETQLLGGELTSLCLAAPLAIIAGVRWWRGRPIAPTLAMGPAAYALYTYVQFVLVPDYTRYAGNNEYFFPFYLALVWLASFVLVRGWRSLMADRVPALPSHLARMLGVALIVLNGAFALAWATSIAAAYRGPLSVEYLEHPTAFWLIRLMDFGAVIPLGLITGIGLLRRAAWSARLAHAFVGVQALLACAVAGMAILMTVRDDPAASAAMLAISVIAAAVFASMFSAMATSAFSGAGSRPLHA